MLHYEVSHSVKLLFLFFLRVNPKTLPSLPFSFLRMQPMRLERWEAWTGGSSDTVGVAVHLFICRLQWLFTDDSVFVCVKGRWLKKLWDQSSPKTSRSPSESLRRCWSPTVSDSKVSLLHFKPGVHVNTWRLVKLPQLTVLPVCTPTPPPPPQAPPPWPQHVEAAWL